MLAATEAIVGQLYLVSVVALVVSAYGRRRVPRRKGPIRQATQAGHLAGYMPASGPDAD